jgi:hypothetical protein
VTNERAVAQAVYHNSMVVRVGDGDECGVFSGSGGGGSGGINFKVDIGGVNQRHIVGVVELAIAAALLVLTKGPDEPGRIEAGKQQHLVALPVRDEHSARVRHNDHTARVRHHVGMWGKVRHGSAIGYVQHDEPMIIRIRNHHLRLVGGQGQTPRIIEFALHFSFRTDGLTKTESPKMYKKKCCKVQGETKTKAKRSTCRKGKSS